MSNMVGGSVGAKRQSSTASSQAATLWQHPYVDLFKHFKVIPQGDWRQNKKQGDVEEIFVISAIFVNISSLLGQGDWAQSSRNQRKHLC